MKSKVLSLAAHVFLRVCFFSVILAFLSLGSMACASSWNTIVVGEQTTPEKLATLDLERYFAQVLGEKPQVLTAEQWNAHPAPATLVGTREGNFLLKDCDLGKSQGQPEDYVLSQTTLKGQPVVMVVGAQGAGTVNAVYGLLRELGYGFFLGSETVPASLPEQLSSARIVKVPALGIRGVLPWYNFFDSPTTWDPIDHRTFVDQLIRSGANFVGFHTYDAEPFGAVIEGDKVKWGARLLSTVKPTWGTVPTKTSDFGFGTGNLYAQDYFGAKTTELQDPLPKVVQTEQDIMRDALDYAKARGLHACIGVEIHRNPMNPVEADAFLQRFNHILDQYPGADYVWLWQPETWGASGFNKPDKNDTFYPTLRNFGMERREVFHRIVDEAQGIAPFFEKTEEGKINRAIEGARLEQYAMLAWRALQHRKDAPRLVISGWGGDKRILSAEYYQGLDRVLPKDIVFSSLDVIGPIRRVDEVYGALSPDRQRWPIPWLENDGDQWMPQPYVDIYQDLMQKLEKSGSQGVLGIHWRTRCIEENLQFLVDYAWTPGLRSDAFYTDFARRKYGEAIAKPMAEIHLQLDRLPYRWIGGKGQVECGSFNWGVVGDQKLADQLGGLRTQCEALLSTSGAGRESLEWLITRMNYVLAYRQAQADFLAAEALYDKGDAGGALDLLNRGSLAKALQYYAGNISTRGEYGVLATINSKAVISWKNLRYKCVAKLGTDKPDPFANWNPQPSIVLPRLIGSTVEGMPLELNPVVLGGGPGWLHYRTVGEKEWTSIPLVAEQRWVKQGVIPAEAVKAPGLEFAFSLDGKIDKTFAWGPHGVTVMPAVPTSKSEKNTVILPENGTFQLNIGKSDHSPVTLQWEQFPEADYFRVYRDDQFLGVTGVGEFADIPDHKNGSYRVEAVRDGKVVMISTAAYQVWPVP